MSGNLSTTATQVFPWNGSNSNSNAVDQFKQAAAVRRQTSSRPVVNSTEAEQRPRANDIEAAALKDKFTNVFMNGNGSPVTWNDLVSAGLVDPNTQPGTLTDTVLKSKVAQYVWGNNAFPGEESQFYDPSHWDKASVGSKLDGDSYYRIFGEWKAPTKSPSSGAVYAPDAGNGSLGTGRYDEVLKKNDNDSRTTPVTTNQLVDEGNKTTTKTLNSSDTIQAYGSDAAQENLSRPTSYYGNKASDQGIWKRSDWLGGKNMEGITNAQRLADRLNNELWWVPGHVGATLSDTSIGHVTKAPQLSDTVETRNYTQAQALQGEQKSADLARQTNIHDTLSGQALEATDLKRQMAARAGMNEVDFANVINQANLQVNYALKHQGNFQLAMQSYMKQLGIADAETKADHITAYMQTNPAFASMLGQMFGAQAPSIKSYYAAKSLSELLRAVTSSPEYAKGDTKTRTELYLNAVSQFEQLCVAQGVRQSVDEVSSLGKQFKTSSALRKAEDKANKAYEKYTNTVAEYGSGSRQAADAYGKYVNAYNKVEETRKAVSSANPSFDFGLDEEAD